MRNWRLLSTFEFPVAGNLAGKFCEFGTDPALAGLYSCSDSSVVHEDARISRPFGAGNLFRARREFIRAWQGIRSQGQGIRVF